MDIATTATNGTSHSTRLNAVQQLPRRSILKRVLDLQLLVKVNHSYLIYTIYILCVWKYIWYQTTKIYIYIANIMREMIDFVEIEINFTCRTKIYRWFKWLEGLATKPALATFTCNGFMPETWSNRSTFHRCDWLWIFENHMQTKWWGNLWDRSHCARLFNYADILLH